MKPAILRIESTCAPPLTQSVRLLLMLAIGLVGPRVRAASEAETNPKGEAPPAKKAVAGRARQRLEWNRKTLVEAYDKVGKKDAKWDEIARKCLVETAILRTNPGPQAAAQQKKVAGLSHQAVRLGCDDPLLVYLDTRYYQTEVMATNELAGQFRTCADHLQRSDYPAIRKFYANLRAAEWIKIGPGHNTNTPPEVHGYRRAAMANLLATLEDQTTPIGEAVDACLDLLRVVEANKKQYEEFYRAMEKPLFKNWPQEGGIFLVKGAFHIRYAWIARGNGYANTVTEQNWRLFAERLKTAGQALERAWELDPTDSRICHNMISVELGGEGERAKMERWFQRGMELDPNDYDLCLQKLYYLEPKWHGEPKDMIEFGRACVGSERWGGGVPLVLVAAYESLSRYADKAGVADFWKSEEVWADVRSAFERYFKVNPEAQVARNAYAKYAYRCGQWKMFVKQIELLGPMVDSAIFGGQAQFDNMLQTAKTQADREK